MLSAWLLPEHIADVLPAEAARIESLRRTLLDRARRCGFELVMPPMLEHLEALLSGTGRGLDLETFKLVDQMSGRTLGLRGDTTPQAARIDAHLLNHEGVTRLCYCGPVLHTRPRGLRASREPLQFGAEIFGHAGLEADLEAQELAVQALRSAGIRNPTLDLADARLLQGVLAGVPLDAMQLHEVAQALSEKDAAGLRGLTVAAPAVAQQALQSLTDLYGGRDVLQRAASALPDRPLVRRALEDLSWLANHLERIDPTLEVSFDLSDMSGYAYYSGPRFALYADGWSDALARGGRYDEVGSVFGRNRPAVGFSLDLKTLAEASPSEPPACAAILAPWSEDGPLRAEVRRLRDAGEVVVFALPGQAAHEQAQACDRELVPDGEGWGVRARQALNVTKE